MKKSVKYFSIKIITLIIFMTAMFMTDAALAKAPEGTPPAGDACDVLAGPPKGLCYVYCEVMDCDTGERGTNFEVCGRIYDKLVEFTGEVPPCDLQE